MPQGIEGQGSAPAAQIAQFRSDGFTGYTGLRIPFFSDSFSRAFGFPEVRLKNMVSESTPLREERPYAAYVGLREIRYSRPGLVTGFNYGAGPIRGLYAQSGVMGGDLFVVSGSSIYRNGANVGTLAGTDLVRFAASPAQLIAVAGGNAYLYDGVANPTFTQVSNGVLPTVSDVTYLAGRFVYVSPTGPMWYYSEVYDAANVTGLDFASNNDSPANNVAVRVLNDQLVFLTASTVDFWSPNADVASAATTPFLPSQGRGFQRGCLARDTVAFADNAIFWVGDNGVVYRSGNVPARVSSSSVEDKIRQCPSPATMNAFVVTFEGHEFYVLNIPTIGTFAYDVSRVGTAQGEYGHSLERGEWAEWASFGRPNFQARCAAVWKGQVYVGDDASNDAWAMKVGVWQDGANPLTRQASAFVKIEEGRPRMDGLVLHCVAGVGNPVNPGATPLVEMRYSDDLGRQWSPWRATPLGAQGVYLTRAYWQRLGLMRAPGRLIEVRCAEPVDVAFSHLELNPLRAAN